MFFGVTCITVIDRSLESPKEVLVIVRVVDQVSGTTLTREPLVVALQVNGRDTGHPSTPLSALSADRSIPNTDMIRVTARGLEIFVVSSSRRPEVVSSLYIICPSQTSCLIQSELANSIASELECSYCTVYVHPYLPVACTDQQSKASAAIDTSRLYRDTCQGL